MLSPTMVMTQRHLSVSVAAEVHLRREATRGKRQEPLGDGEILDPRGEQRGRVALPNGAGVGRGRVRIDTGELT